MLTISRPPGRSTRCNSASVCAGSTAPWQSRSAAIAASKHARCKWQRIDAATHDGRAGLVGGAPRGRLGPLQTNRMEVGTLGKQPCQQTTGAAAGVQHVAIKAGQRGDEATMQRAVPPHVVLDRIHPRVFRELHPDPRNDRCCLPCRGAGRKAWRRREPGGTFRWLMSCRWRALCRACSRTTPPTRSAALGWRSSPI